MSDDSVGASRRVLRRCALCRLLFEAPETVDACVVCGERVVGLALPLGGEPIPQEMTEREPTAPLLLRRPSEGSSTA